MKEFGFPFLLTQLLFYIVPVMMVVIIGMSILRSFKEWKHNENSPRLTVEAKIVCKRSDFRRRSTGNGHRSSRIYYYVTFEVESGDRMELQLQGHEYGLLMEGDRGRLTFQGTRYLGFERI